MEIYINSYTSHLNQFLYSLLEYSSKYKVKVKLFYDKNIKTNSVMIDNDGITYFLDYSDDTEFCDENSLYDFYFKRSLREGDMIGNIKPLNFQINIATKPFKLLTLLPKDLEFIKKSKIEIIRLIDFLKFTNMSHSSMNYESYVKGQQIEGNGKVIFFTRLWDPDNNNNQQEKNRRRLQNEFRVMSCRIIKSQFKNSVVGIFDSKLAREICPDLIFPNKIVSKKEYFKQLSLSSICIADDGLKDTPGWKIGEYALMGKSIISTPLNVVIEGFRNEENYLQLSDRNSFEELPEKIEILLTDKNYLNMADLNLKWAKNYLDPVNYILRILEQ